MKGRHEGSRKGWQAEPARNPAAPHTAPPVATRPTLHPTTTPVKTNHFLSHNHAVTTPECVANFLHRLLLGQPARINQMSRRPEPASSPIWVIRPPTPSAAWDPCQVGTPPIVLPSQGLRRRQVPRSSRAKLEAGEAEGVRARRSALGRARSVRIAICGERCAPCWCCGHAGGSS
jgi:hypothetical protein